MKACVTHLLLRDIKNKWNIHLMIIVNILFKFFSCYICYMLYYYYYYLFLAFKETIYFTLCLNRGLDIFVSVHD